MEADTMASIEKVQVRPRDIHAEKYKLLCLGTFKDKELSGQHRTYDSELSGAVADLLERDDFQGEQGETALLYPDPGQPVERVLLIGLGEREKCDLDTIRNAAGTAARAVQEKRISDFAIDLDADDSLDNSPEEIGQATAEGLIMGSYKFMEYRTRDTEKYFFAKKATILGEKRISDAVEQGVTLAKANLFTRDLATHPSNVMTPSRLAQEAETIAKEGGFKCRVYDRSEIEGMGMGAFAGVARGTSEPPKFILLEYYGGERDEPPLAFAGKGITFDTGGISIKPSKKMDQMKFDMCGAAAVLGIFHAIARLKPEVNAIGAVVATENMPGGKAYKPGDILKAYNGKTIEVLNTDAEGRLALADGLSYVVQEFSPEYLIDFATLTGAAVVALGHRASALMGTDDKLVRDIIGAGEYTGERCWQLPLWDGYSDDLKSEVADVKNIGEQGAGSITAGAFLKEFVDDTKWAHLDIAGTAWWSEDRPYIPKGASGVGPRLVMRWLDNLIGEK